MEVNPIKEKLMAYLEKECVPVNFNFEDRLYPNVVFFVFDDGKTDRIETNPKDQQQATNWMKDARMYFQVQQEKGRLGRKED